MNTRLKLSLSILGTFLFSSGMSVIWLPYKLDDTSGLRLESPSWHHLLGTDKLGRDYFSRLIVGSRIVVIVGITTVIIGALIGVSLGLLAGFARRTRDDTFSAFLDILIAFPTLLLAMLIVAARGASLTSAILAISLGISAVLARLTRLLTKRVLGADYILAARASGTSWFRIVIIHILPNIWTTLIVALSLQFGLAGLAEAGLSYLGLGAPPPNASWGSLLQEAQDTVYTAPIAAIAPGLLLVILVVGVNLFADGLRERFDPTLGGNQ